MRIRNSMIASAVLLSLGFAGQAWGQATNTVDNGSLGLIQVAVDADSTDDHSGNDRNNSGTAAALGIGSAAANNHSSATTSISDSFNTSNAIATTNLLGAVTGNSVHDIGNTALTVGLANGGNGGSASASSGDAGAGSLAAGGDGLGGIAAAISGAGASANGAGDDSADARARARARGGNGRGGDATSGDAMASSGDSTATGGDGGSGGSVYSDAGSFDMSNQMNGSANAAAGIMVVAQNSGASSLIQQGVTVQANLAVGH